ncbi:MAG TPA: response regulator [Anaeromyxobacter sp.]|nr:response regulator [Anaeromyxobacter sp.]
MGFQILIVDDSPVTRKMVRRALASCGLQLDEVHEAADGAEALALLATRRVDLVLADVNMPVMGGEELVERMARDPGLAGIPVIVVATPTSEERVRRLLAAGARAYIAKPFGHDALRDAVVGVLRGKP